MTGIVREERIGPHRLILGDCLEVMPDLGPVDAVVTDPPYGINRANGLPNGGTDGSGRYKRKPRQYADDWDNRRPADDVLMRLRTLGGIVWGGNYFADVLGPGGRWLVWDKKNAMPTFSDAELAWTSLSGVSLKMLSVCAGGLAANRDTRVHPTQKPLAVMRWCLTFLPDARTILDPFMGSGTTIVACHHEGRAGIGIEIDPDYFDIACKRVEDAIRQPALDFGEPDAARRKPEQGSLTWD